MSESTSDVVGTIPPKPEPNEAKGDGAKKRPAKVLPTTRVGFQKQLTMLRSYAELGAPDKPVSTVEVAKLVGLHPNTASYANPFLVDAGLMQKVGSGYTPSAEAVAYHRAMAWNPTTAPYKIAPVLRRTWFGRALLPKLSLAPMAEREAIQELAHEAAAGTDYAGALSVILEYLEVSGLIRREAGKVLAGNTQPEEQMPRSDAPVDTETVAEMPRERRPGNIATAFSQAPEGVLRFNVDVSVDMKEFASWKPERIAAFWAGIAQVLSAKADVERNG